MALLRGSRDEFWLLRLDRLSPLLASWQSVLDKPAGRDDRPQAYGEDDWHEFETGKHRFVRSWTAQVACGHQWTSREGKRCVLTEGRLGASKRRSPDEHNGRKEDCPEHPSHRVVSLALEVRLSVRPDHSDEEKGDEDDPSKDLCRDSAR